MPSITLKKEKYAAKLEELLGMYDRALVVHCDNVGSQQFQDIRMALRPSSHILMGKNTLMKKCIANYIKKTGDDKWKCLISVLVGNVGIVFTSLELGDVRTTIEQFKMPAAAKVGAIAPVDVSVLAGPTGMGPEATAFFQILNIATKINKGAVEILNDVQVVKAGEKVGSSEAALMSKMKMMPFQYGLVVQQVVDNGEMFSPKVLDITDDDVKAAFAAGLRNIASISLELSYPTLAAVPHCIINGYKNCIALCLEVDYCFEAAQAIKDRF